MDYASLGLWGLFASAFVSSTLAPGGSEAVLAYLASQAQIPAYQLLLTATVGNTLGAMSTWWLGLWAARSYSPDSHRLEKYRKSLDAVRRYGAPILLLSWLPLVGDGFCFAAGWLRTPLLISLAAIALGKLGRYAAIIYLFS